MKYIKNLRNFILSQKNGSVKKLNISNEERYVWYLMIISFISHWSYNFFSINLCLEPQLGLPKIHQNCTGSWKP